MNNPRLILWAVATLSIAVPSVGHAGEETPLKSEIPPLILLAVKKMHPGAKHFTYHRGMRGPLHVWEIKSRGDRTEREYILSQHGELLEEKEAVTIDELPKKAMSAFKSSKYSGWMVKKISKVTLPGKEATPLYQIDVLEGGIWLRLSIDANGSLKPEAGAQAEHTLQEDQAQKNRL